MKELCEMSATELVAGLSGRVFSSEELVSNLLQRVEKYKDLNAYITLSKERILEQARQADKRIKDGEKGPLLGVPVGVKDVILTEGERTTSGSKILGNFIPPYDATVVKKLKAAGAVIFGKLNMDEFAMGSSNENSAYGPVLSPWDRTRVPGGSSGGSAAVVSARLSPLALGTDTGGSIRQPAALTGVVGIKPTYGRVSRYGVIAYASSLDQVGSFARSVSDAALLTQIISGRDSNDSTSVDEPVPDFGGCEAPSLKGLKVGLPKEYFVPGMSDEIVAAVKVAIKKLEELGASIVEVSLPHTDLALPVYYVLAPAEASSNLARYDGVRFGHRAAEFEDLTELYNRSRGEGFGGEVKRRIMIGTYVLSSGYYDAFYLRAQKVRTLIVRDFKEAFERCDVIAAPVTPSTAFKIGEKANDPLAMYLSDIFTIPVNLAGLPGMSVPCGMDGLGLPIGLQLIGRPWEEGTMFKVASAYERGTDWHLKRPREW